jgi:hypothetical protein
MSVWQYIPTKLWNNTTVWAIQILIKITWALQPPIRIREDIYRPEYLLRHGIRSIKFYPCQPQSCSHSCHLRVTHAGKYFQHLSPTQWQMTSTFCNDYLLQVWFFFFFFNDVACNAEHIAAVDWWSNITRGYGIFPAGPRKMKENLRKVGVPAHFWTARFPNASLKLYSCMFPNIIMDLIHSFI